jgi:FAD/FMN-containing dehydrogenase
VLSQSQTQAQMLWQLREGISESISPYTPYKNDLSVRVSEMPGFLDEVDALVQAEYPDFDVCWYGHIGDGNLHLNILKPAAMTQQEFYQRCHHISPKIFERVAARGGSISAEHGVGLLKRDFLGYTRSPEEIEVMRAIKAVLDPNGIMNPGKLLTAVPGG